jgi:uncharacterized phage-associated protein
MTAKDWTLLAIGAAKGRALTPVQLQKALFLLARNLPDRERHTSTFYEFRAYDYGPFNAEIYRDAQRLRSEGLILIDPAESVAYRDYTVTPSGSDQCAELREQLDLSTVDYLDRVVQWVRSLSFDALVRAIYRDYPEMKANSVFRD